MLICQRVIYHNIVYSISFDEIITCHNNLGLWSVMPVMPMLDLLVDAWHHVVAPGEQYMFGVV